MSLTPQQLVRAHQYLYAVANRPVWRDSDYDLFCTRHGIEGGLSSEYEADYTDEDRALAAKERVNPTDPMTVMWSCLPPLADLRADRDVLQARMDRDLATLEDMDELSVLDKQVRALEEVLR